MRKIPIHFNGDESRIIGYLEVSDVINDNDLRDMYLSWLWMPERRKIIAASLTPMLSIKTRGK